MMNQFCPSKMKLLVLAARGIFFEQAIDDDGGQHDTTRDHDLPQGFARALVWMSSWRWHPRGSAVFGR
jgi:hypothetical protein